MDEFDFNKTDREALDKFTKKVRRKRPSFKVICMECQRKFTTTNPTPECPKCGGVDIEPREFLDESGFAD